jgi:hypothetical protein
MNLISRYGCRHSPKVITVLFSIIVSLILASHFCCAEDVTLQWDPSPSAKAVGYKVHINKVLKEDHSVVDVGNVTFHVVRDLSNDEEYMFSVTAYGATGSESRHSNLVYWRSRQTGILAEDLMFLRRIRDRYLATNQIGRLIIQVYEWISPPLVDLYQKREAFRMLTRWILAPLVFTLKHPLRFAVVLVTIITFASIGIMFRKRNNRKSAP